MANNESNGNHLWYLTKAVDEMEASSAVELGNRPLSDPIQGSLSPLAHSPISAPIRMQQLHHHVSLAGVQHPQIYSNQSTPQHDTSSLMLQTSAPVPHGLATHTLTSDGNPRDTILPPYPGEIRVVTMITTSPQSPVFVSSVQVESSKTQQGSPHQEFPVVQDPTPTWNFPLGEPGVEDGPTRTSNQSTRNTVRDFAHENPSKQNVPLAETTFNPTRKKRPYVRRKKRENRKAMIIQKLKVHGSEIELDKRPSLAHTHGSSANQVASSAPLPQDSDVRRSKYVGVRWYKRTSKWVVQIRRNGKRKHVGYFTDEEEAAVAYKIATEMDD